MTRKAGKNKKIMPGLYIVSTPIGNLGDITLRAQAVLEQADIIACEDTRVTGKLLGYFDIGTPTIAYHDHNEQRILPQLMERLAEGQIVAL
ncbi:MAG: hypothetical protein JKY59_09010, partial [Emcibacter sp.]|nr:hypothetical protein [Emcibacter sp.]